MGLVPQQCGILGPSLHLIRYMQQLFCEPTVVPKDAENGRLTKKFWSLSQLVSFLAEPLYLVTPKYPELHFIRYIHHFVPRRTY